MFIIYEVIINDKQRNIHLNDLRPERIVNEVDFNDESPYASLQSSGEEFEFQNVESELPDEEPTYPEEVVPIPEKEPTKHHATETTQTKPLIPKETELLNLADTLSEAAVISQLIT